MTLAAPAAVAAFLRGIERRAALLAELQGGDPVAGDAAVAATMRAFAAGAGRWAVAAWPRHFWTSLLAAPALRRARAGHWPAEFAHLATLGSGFRAAVLLRLVAGLDAADAAAVLDVDVAGMHQTLQRALAGPDGSVDADAWRKLDAAAQQALRQLPAARLVALAQRREAALLAPQPPARQTRPISGPKASVPRWRVPLLWSAGAVCAAAFAATFVWPLTSSHVRHDDAVARIRRAPLPAAAAPAATFDADTALLSHRDFEQLADAEARPVVRELAFYAWYAAEHGTQPAPPLAEAADADSDKQEGGDASG